MSSRRWIVIAVVVVAVQVLGYALDVPEQILRLLQSFLPTPVH